MSSTPDGRFLLFASESKRTGTDLWLLPLPGGTRAMTAPSRISIRSTARCRRTADGSPTCRTSPATTKCSHAGSRRIPPPAPSSQGLGNSSRAAVVRVTAVEKDGRELFYQSRGGAVMSVTVDAASLARPRAFFRVPGIQTEWSVSETDSVFSLRRPVARAPTFTVGGSRCSRTDVRWA
jgi:hypothetical protein